jgi:hypothetical protein
MGKVSQRRIYFVLERKKSFFAKTQQTVAFHFIGKAEQFGYSRPPATQLKLKKILWN